MRQSTWYIFCILGLATLCLSSPIAKRETLDENDALDPAEQELSDLDDENRDKRKIEGAIELKYGAKNAILGLIFNKLNSFIDTKTRWVAQLDQTNIAKNKQYGIEAPKDAVTSFGTVFSSPIDPRIPISYSVGSGAALPRVAVVIPQGAGYGQGVPQGAGYAQGVPQGAGYAQGIPQGAGYAQGVPQGAHYPHDAHYPQPHPQSHLQGYLPDQGHLPTHGLAAKRALPGVPTTTEDAVNFTPGQKVSLDLPDPLFGSGFGLVTDVSKAAGSFIQNSAERTAQIFEAMKPFFKFVFGVDSLKITRDVPHDNDVK